MDIYTSTYRYNGIDRLDITVKGNDHVGRIFAPTWDMVMGIKNGTMSEEEYTLRYMEIVATAIVDYNDIFFPLLIRKRITAVCFCPAGAFCHRVLWARALVTLGHDYKGEIPWQSNVTAL